MIILKKMFLSLFPAVVAARSGERTKRCRASNLAWLATSGSRRSTPDPSRRTRTGRSSSRAERIPPKHRYDGWRRFWRFFFLLDSNGVLLENVHSIREVIQTKNIPNGYVGLPCRSNLCPLKEKWKPSQKANTGAFFGRCHSRLLNCFTPLKHFWLVLMELS